MVVHSWVLPAGSGRTIHGNTLEPPSPAAPAPGGPTFAERPLRSLASSATVVWRPSPKAPGCTGSGRGKRSHLVKLVKVGADGRSVCSQTSLYMVKHELLMVKQVGLRTSTRVHGSLLVIVGSTKSCHWLKDWSIALWPLGCSNFGPRLEAREGVAVGLDELNVS